MKFLLVRFSAIGDCVLAAHAATSVRTAHPDAFIAWAIESRCAPVISVRNAGSDGLIDLRHDFPRQRWSKIAWSPLTWWEAMRTYSGLRRYRFDLGADLQGHSKTALCLYLAKPKKRIAAWASDSFAKRLNPVVEGDPIGRHVTDWNHYTLSHLGDFPFIDRPIMPHLEEESKAFRERLGGDTSRIVTIATGAGALDKQWPIDRWESVARELRTQGCRIVYLGGQPDPHPNDPEGTDLVGKLPLGETMAAVKASVLHLSGDTGTGHIAAAYRIPQVSVFGPTDPRRYRPLTDVGTLLAGGTATTNIGIQEVVEAATVLLSK